MTKQKENTIIGDDNTEVFTINEYREYKEKYELHATGLSDINKEYQYVNNVHDKTYRKLSDITIKTMIKSKFNKKQAEEILNNLRFERGNSMFRVEEMFKREERRFRAEGKREGKIEGKIEIIKNMLKEKFTIGTIASVSGMNEKEIEKIAKEMN